MSSMIERVARAIDPQAFEHWEEAYRRKDRWDQVNRIGALTAAREKARAAIEAMREPTDAMEDAADDPVHEELKKQGQFSIKNYGKLAFASYPFSNSVWKAMIEAALKEE